MASLASKGSQRWLQLAVNRKQELLAEALRDSGALPKGASVSWAAPLECKRYAEHRDEAALAGAGVDLARLKVPLRAFWPKGGPRWDAEGESSDGAAIFLEAKSHVSELNSNPTGARDPKAAALIRKSLQQARKHYARAAAVEWGHPFYQYVNRLAHHYWLAKLNGRKSRLVFLYFLNDLEMGGPSSVQEWRAAINVLHLALGLPGNISRFGVFEAFLDVRQLQAGATA